MQMIINVPDNMPLDKIEKLIAKLERKLKSQAETQPTVLKRPIGLAKGDFQVSADLGMVNKQV